MKTIAISLIHTRPGCLLVTLLMKSIVPVLLCLCCLPLAVISKPNFLFIVSDDLNTRIGPYVDESPKIHTPALDRLATEGVSFTRAYCQYPVCGPSRAAFMSGLYPESNGVTDNAFETGNHKIASPSLADHPTFAGFLRENNYYTARVSKIFHMGVPGGIERGEAGSDDPDSWDWTVNIMAPETLTPGNLENLSRGLHYGGRFARMILPDDMDYTQADVLATNQAIAILENRATAKPEGATNRTKFKEEDPFFLAVGLVRPHVPLIAPERHFAHYPDEEVVLSGDTRKDLQDVPELAAATSNHQSYQMNEEEQRKSIAAYHASISFMDEQVGRLLDTLDRLELRKNTVVVFISDHGFNLGEHTAWQKSSLWEESVRVPVIVSVPDMQTAGQRSEAIVELNDLYPTFLELAGYKNRAPDILQGESLVPLLEDPRAFDSSDYAYTIVGQKGASIRTDHWRYSRWGEEAEGGNEELYDHRQDPRENHNLARNLAHIKELQQLRARFEKARTLARQKP